MERTKKTKLYTTPEGKVVIIVKLYGGLAKCKTQPTGFVKEPEEELICKVKELEEYSC